MSDDTEYVSDADLGPLESMVTAHAHPSNAGYPAFVEPEPQMIKGRFGRMKEERVDFGASLHCDDAESGALQVMFTAPNQDQVVASMTAGQIELPPGWLLHPTMPDSGVVVSTGPPDAHVVARWLIDTMLAMGAPLPTGRWRCYSPTVHHPHND